MLQMWQDKMSCVINVMLHFCQPLKTIYNRINCFISNTASRNHNKETSEWVIFWAPPAPFKGELAV